MDLGLDGKLALVTGGSRGIGKAVARRLAEEGASVAVLARDAAALEAAAAELREATGATVVAVAGDVGSDESVEAAVAAAAAALGGLDVVVNCAARLLTGQVPPKLPELGEETLWPEINVKVLGYIRVIRAAVPHLRARGGGRIVNVSGLAARATGSTITSIRNVAVAALTKNLAEELAADDIAVVVVHPGQTETERTPESLAALAERQGVDVEEARRRLVAPVLLGRMVRADEVADVVAFLASPRATAINGDAVAAGGGTKGPIFY